LNFSKVEFYKVLSKDLFPGIVDNAQRIMSMFASSYVCEQTFSVMKSRKNSIRTRLTDEHLFSLLKVSSSQMDPDFESIMSTQKQFHQSHSSNNLNPPK
jgi:17beta-estradiol 17-dehydrogenase/3beta-hydroxysteroid 3-dehydrogenase/mitotic-spindle organizing protein 1